MKAMQKLSILLFCFIVLNGCSTVRQAILRGFQKSPERIYTQKAATYEKQGDLHQALIAWRVVERLDPEDKSIPATIKALEKEIFRSANEYYKKGVTYHEKGDLPAARRNFLIALRIMPDHRQAFSYLKFRLSNDGKAVYKVVSGDSYTKIATDVYNDPTKAYAIAFFNDLNPRKPLMIATELVLPQLPSKYIVPRKDIDAKRERAQTALDQGRYDDVLQIASDIEAQQPSDPNITSLRDTVYFRRGMALLEKKSYASAIEQLKQVSPGYAGRKKAIGQARQHLKKEATAAKVAQAQHYLDQKAYAKSIATCEEILTRDPFNRKAKTIFNAAHYAWGKKLLDEEKEAEAIKILGALDKGYQDTAQLLTQARARLHARAESLYRQGVKYFLNEDLEKAIHSWSEALKLYPEHPKAKQDIENAIRLLDKWRDLDENGDQKSSPRP